MDEIERSQFDRLQVDIIVGVVGQAAFYYTNDHGDAARAMIAEMRREADRKDTVN